MPKHAGNKRTNRHLVSQLPRSIRRRVIRETLCTMSENQRLALALYHYEKLGPAGIAEALKISPRDADRLLITGRAQVIHALDREEKSSHGGW